MAIVDIQQGWTGVQAGGDDRVRTYSDVFTLLDDDPSRSALFDWPVTDGTTTIPAPGTSHSEDAAYVSGVPQVEKLGGGLFRVTVPYETTDPEAPQLRWTDPLNAPAEIRGVKFVDGERQDAEDTAA